MLNPKQRTGGLRELADLTRGHPEETGSLSLFDRNIDTSDPGIIHPSKGFQAGPGIHDRNTHLGADCLSFFHGSLNGLLRFFKRHMHGRLLPPYSYNDFHEFGILTEHTINSKQPGRFSYCLSDQHAVKRVFMVKGQPSYARSMSRPDRQLDEPHLFGCCSDVIRD